MYFDYLVRLKQFAMDSIIEVLPFLLAETVQVAVKEKFSDRKLPLHSESICILFVKSIFLELYGYETSDLCFKRG